jgi:hypothetical protein
MPDRKLKPVFKILISEEVTWPVAYEAEHVKAPRMMMIK